MFILIMLYILLLLFLKLLSCLKELRNCILSITCAWSWYCSVQFYLFSTCFFLKLGLCFSLFLILKFLYLWFLDLCFEFNAILKDLIKFIKSASIISDVLFNYVLLSSLYTKDLLKYKNHVIKRTFYL